MSKKDHKPSKMKNFFKFRKSTTDLSEWSKNDEKLMKATENNDLQKIDELLRKKSLNPTKLGPKGLSVFHVACHLGFLEVVDLLISNGAEVNVLAIQGNTSVQIAARDGHPKVVEKLLQAGGVIDHKDGLSLTALHHACVRGKLHCVQVLLKNKADPNSRDKTGKPPLFYAAFSEDLPICKELVDHGANVNASDESQIAPLMAAAKKGSVEICEFLLRKGADPKMKDKSGNDALAYGLDAGFAQLTEVFQRAPAQAAWTVTQETAGAQSANGAKSNSDDFTPVPGPVEVEADDHHSVGDPVDKENMVAKFHPESSPELSHKQIEIPAEVEDIMDDETLALQAAAPPQAVIDQRTLEAVKELEEENASMNEDLKRLVSENKKLQEAYNTLKKQLSTPAPPPVDQEEVQELEDEVTTLKAQLTEEQDKNVRLIDKVHKMKKKFGLSSETGGDSDGDSWNDSDDELFDSSSLRRPQVVDHKPQTLLLLQNEVTRLKQDNKQLRERLQSGSVSSLVSLDEMSEVERLRRKVEDLEIEKKLLLKKLQDNNVLPEEQLQSLRVLEEENTHLLTEVKQLRNEIISMKQTSIIVEINSDAVDKGVDSEHNALSEMHEAFRKENVSLKTENGLLNEELQALRDTYSKLVVAGDNLQDMYDTLVAEKEQLQKDFVENELLKQQLAKENEILLSDSNSMNQDIHSLVSENEKLHNNCVELEKKLATANQGAKASDFAKVVDERDKLKETVQELEVANNEFKQNYEIVCEEVESLQSSVQRAEYERDQIQQEFDSLTDEYENLQSSHEGLQQDYNQLEQEYSELLADKEKLEQEFLEVQTASVSVEHHNPAVAEERDKLQQDNEVLAIEKEQLEMTIKELSKSNALLNEELSSLKESLDIKDKDSEKKEKRSEGNKKPSEATLTMNGNTNSDGSSDPQKVSVDALVEKDKRIRSLQIQISRLQQQIAAHDKHYKDVINTYRTHLLSAVQGHLDPDVKQALFTIIEQRSNEQYC
ncbi:ankycorbin-like isoform X2 [Dreissena polymorpha]|uniref:ankycorbin-like isoform X2 n=1 Tax=Dreissena polymorpha TaxID=45954 RepID=UPI0022655AC2|nr:ankycorbin-like isoform X2 [Dreissena polymorpha]